MDKKEIHKFVAERFIKIREANKFTARRLSLKLGKSLQYINQIENQHKMPSIEMVFNFCEAMKIEPYVFFTADYTYPKQFKALLKYLSLLDLDEIAEILAIAKRYAQNKTTAKQK